MKLKLSDEQTVGMPLQGGAHQFVSGKAVNALYDPNLHRRDEVMRVPSAADSNHSGQLEKVIEDMRLGYKFSLRKESDELLISESNGETQFVEESEAAALVSANASDTTVSDTALPEEGQSELDLRANARDKTIRESPTPDEPTWVPEGFWPRFIGVALIGGIALATDDDDSDSDVNSANSAPIITSNGGGASAAINLAESIAVVTTVVALDFDVGASVRYSISGGTDASLFTINSTSGVLSFTSARNFDVPQDSDLNNVYNVIVTASDGRLTDTQAISVTITQANDTSGQQPVISSSGGGDTAQIELPEGSGTVTTVQADAPGAGNTVAYSLSGGADAALFSINSSTGSLGFLATPDFEMPQDQGANNVYEIVVVASAGGGSDSQAISVTITDQEEPTATSLDAASMWTPSLLMAALDFGRPVATGPEAEGLM